MNQSRKLIAVVSPDQRYRRALRCALKSDSYEVETFPRAGDLAAGACPAEFDCLVIDTDLSESVLFARAQLDLAAYLRNEVPVILVTPEDSRAPAQLSLPAVTKNTPALDLLVLVHHTMARARKIR